ncbi:MAG: 8-oxoguanine DNA glycosylase, partial [Halobacteria archaeon]|nr:8-oxoguanine DNA glycosylase [Halobacteria archaeon]
AYSFPESERLAEVSENELRGLGLGYRAPYVIESSRMIADGEIDPADLRAMGYHEAHQEVQKLVGVGDKVADCVLLFS